MGKVLSSVSESSKGKHYKGSKTSLTLYLYWSACQLDSFTKRSHLQTHTNTFQNWKTEKPVSTAERTGLIAGYPQNGHLDK